MACWDNLKGECKRGSKCRFSHDRNAPTGKGGDGKGGKGGKGKGQAFSAEELAADSAAFEALQQTHSRAGRGGGAYAGAGGA